MSSMGSVAAMAVLGGGGHVVEVPVSSEHRSKQDKRNEITEIKNNRGFLDLVDRTTPSDFNCRRRGVREHGSTS